MKSKQVQEFKETEIGKIPVDWELKSIKESCEKIIDYRGKTPKKTPFGIILVTAKMVKNGRIDFSKSEFIDFKDYDIWMTRGIPQSGDIVITTEAPLGEVAQLDDKKIALAQRLITLSGTKGVLTNNYLRYVLQSKLVQDQLFSRLTGSTVGGIKQSELRKVLLPIPSVETQNYLSKILIDLDGKIDNLQYQNKILEQTAQAIFKSWFVDFDGVTEFEDSEIGQIPKGWNVVNMSDVIEINPTRNLKKGIIAPYLGMTDIPIYSSRISRFYLKAFTSGMKFMNGDTLVARITPSLENGKTAFVDFLQNDEIGWGSTEYIVLRPKVPIPAEYGYCFARTDEFRSHAILNMTGTSGRQRVPESCFDEYGVVKPPTDSTIVFGNIVKKLFFQIKNNADMIDILIKTRDALLPKLMSGEIRV